MNYRSTPLQSATSARKSFVRSTYRLPFPQPLYNQHLQTRLASIHSKGVITPAESILTDIGSCNLFRINTYEKRGEGGPPARISLYFGNAFASMPGTSFMAFL